MDIRRYLPERNTMSGDEEFVEHQGGAWVRYSDYAAEVGRLGKALREIADGPEFMENDVEGDALKAFAKKAEDIASAALSAQPAVPDQLATKLDALAVAPPCSCAVPEPYGCPRQKDGLDLCLACGGKIAAQPAPDAAEMQKCPRCGCAEYGEPSCEQGTACPCAPGESTPGENGPASRSVCDKCGLCYTPKPAPEKPAEPAGGK